MRSPKSEGDGFLDEVTSSANGDDFPIGVRIRQALPTDVAAIHALMRPYVSRRSLLARTEPELVDLTRNGFVAQRDSQQNDAAVIGFSAVEIYSQKLAELQCLAVHADFQGSGLGRELVQRCVARAKELGVMEVMAITSSESFFHGCGFDFALPDQKKAMFCQLRPRPTE